MDDSTHYERVATAVATHWYNSLAPAMRQALQANLSTNDWTALRDIEVGEEIAYDYAFSGHLAVPCFCKTELCRGVICDPDEYDLVPEQHRHLIRYPRARRKTA